MPGWIRSRIIRLLFKLVDTAKVPEKEYEGDEVRTWLADNWGHPGFREYVRLRDIVIKNQLAGGDQLISPEHRKVWQMTGQRFELLMLAERAKKAYNTRSKYITKKRSR